MRVLVLSTYELGHQPISAATAAGALRSRGHDVRVVDLAVEELDRETLHWPEAVALSVPMHTATRLAVEWARLLKSSRPELKVAVFGLYAAAAARAGGTLVDLAVAGEYEDALIGWLEPGSAASGPLRPDSGQLPSEAAAHPGSAPVRVELGRGVARRPARDLLVGPERYARLRIGQEERLVGYVQASRGCAHRCRHCPVPVVYDGRVRTVPTDDVRADVDRLVGLGAAHVTFADPDFLNAPAHSMRVVRQLHADHPELTFDCTVKVEHILRHEALWPELAAAGLVFVVSAFESVNDAILDRLAKDHTAADAARATRVLRDAGVAVRPSLMPFTPWTSLSDLTELVDFVILNGLIANVDAIQYAIRLLVPPGSLLLDHPASAGVFGPYDPGALSHPWSASDPAVDQLQRELEALADRCSDLLPAEAFPEVHAAVGQAARRAGLPGPRDVPRGPHAVVPGLTEAWFCCAEPTGAQLAALPGGGQACL